MSLRIEPKKNDNQRMAAGIRGGRIQQPSAATQIQAGWYDWFCKDTSLSKKTQRLGGIIKKIQDGGKIDLIARGIDCGLLAL